ncbi:MULTISPECIES: endonuclease Q family protein [unclassified Bacillus (in: firmicutes)]|uniref:endonuclease Q family protein n=1 Tax=unclassified Bacillus (in: firmicutes) TaxID=185979 RepID=UPI0008EF2F38|nr:MULTISPECIES: endonuclease Q family protein [unclassified Bacillus (in: firmicutes)]SFA97654.1 TIGR00375 family protein [Bacillus sp. UNCCL13]SFQ80586.1 TIGR00375 family protein [Bacillus sp. cl95]
MDLFYVDLHIHIGRTASGKPVKITGAKSLTFSNIIHHARDEKGLNMIGIIDSHSPEVMEEMEMLIANGQMEELAEGGLVYGDMSIILGSELEIYDESCQGPIHVLCYLPTLSKMKKFSHWLSQHMKNIQLSSQRVYISGKELQLKTKELEGLFIPAHVFTPFKSLYGKGVKKTLEEVFVPDLIDGIELGLSADTLMADSVNELHRYPYLSNSDAHSLGKIAREYQTIQMEKPTFHELKLALLEREGRGVAANYGLDPLLGKYHQTTCANCLKRFEESELRCSNCGGMKKVKGVASRIMELKNEMGQVRTRPPYIHQVPLDFIPGLGPKLLQRLLNHFGTEMAVLHEVPFEKMKEVIPEKVAQLIMKARIGQLNLAAGGGGKYGKVTE